MSGKLTVIIGSMRSGKSAKLLKLMYQDINKLGYNKVLFVSNKLDNRGFITRDKCEYIDQSKINKIESDSLKSDLYNVINSYKSIFIDEAQFIDDLYPIVDKLLANNINVVLSGLVGDLSSGVFSRLLDYIQDADEIIKLYARCDKCGNDALYSCYIGDNKSESINIGDSDYLVLCRDCFNKSKPIINNLKCE